MRTTTKLVILLAASVCMATTASPQKSPDVRLDVSTPPGATESYSVEIASSGTNVYVVWQEERLGGAGLFFNRSLNGGRDWLPSDERIDASTQFGVRDLAIAVEGDALYVVWSDYANDVYFDRSMDHGSTWLPQEVQVDLGDPPAGTDSREPRIAARGATVVVAWQGGRDFPEGVWANRSLDRGTTWLPVIVQVNVGGSFEGSAGIHLVASDSGIHAAWGEQFNIDERAIYYSRSLDDGLTWLPSSIRLDHAPPGGYATDPRIAACGTAVYAVWWDLRNGAHYFNRSLDSGSTWLPDDLPIPEEPARGSASPGPSIACSDSTVHLAWLGARPNFEHWLLYQRSLDQGLSWLASSTVIDPNGNKGAGDPAMVVENDTVQIVWVDAPASGPGADLLANRSLDGGSTWLPASRKVNLGGSLGDVLVPRIARSAGSTYVAWYDGRSGEYDVYFNLLSGFQSYGSGKAGSAGFVPLLDGGGSASAGEILVVEIDQGLGGSPAVLLTSLAGPADIPTSFGNVLVQPPWSALALLLGGPSGVAGAGSAAISAALPADPNLLGQRVNFQAGILDPGAPNNISLTPGLELWIL